MFFVCIAIALIATIVVAEKLTPFYYQKLYTLQDAEEARLTARYNERMALAAQSNH